MALDIFALIVLAVIIAVVIWLVTLLGPLPGKIAEQRNHPQADAIRVLGSLGGVTAMASLSRRTALDDEYTTLAGPPSGRVAILRVIPPP